MATILLVDDDHDIQRLMSFALQRAGHQVSVAADGREGLQKMAETAPDLIIADLMMPRMNGYEFCRRVRATAGWEQIPILVYSARFQAVDRQAALEAGADDYMPKSVTPDQIVAKINTLLASTAGAQTEAAGRMLGVLSLRGGVGVTSLTVNLAVALALSRKKAIGLLDLTPLAGHAALLLGLTGNKSFLNVFSPGPLGPDSLRSCLIPHATGVNLLASPLSAPPRSAPTPSGAQFAELGQMLRKTYPFTLIDLSHPLSAASEPLFPELARAIVVLGPDIGSIQSAAVTIQRLGDLGLAPERLVLVLNQISPAPGLDPETIQKALHRPVSAVIPYAAEMLAAFNHRSPLMTYAPKSPAAAAIARLAAMVTA